MESIKIAFKETEEELTPLDAAKRKFRNTEEVYTNRDIYSLLYFCSIQFFRFTDAKNLGDDVCFTDILLDKYWRFAGRCGVDSFVMDLVKDFDIICKGHE